MQQFSFNLNDFDELEAKLKPVKDFCKKLVEPKILAHVFLQDWNQDRAKILSEKIQSKLPTASVIGCTSCGGISEGVTVNFDYTVGISVFENTRVEILPLDFVCGEEKISAEKINNAIRFRPNTTAVELIATVKIINPQIFIENIRLPKGTAIFGAGLIGPSDKGEKSFILADDKIIKSGAAIVIYRGEDLKIYVHHSAGWKPLGMEMTVTEADDRTVKRIDEYSAYGIYEKYLQIPRTGNFLMSTLGFPFLIQDRGIDAIRIPYACTEEDYLLFSAEVKQGSKIRLTYGNPGLIFKEVEKCQEKMHEFSPQAIFLYDCITRKFFWQNSINQELKLFQDIAETVGFFCEGEFRNDYGEILVNHQCTLLAIGMREGEPTKFSRNAPKVAEWSFKTDVTMLKRMATFVQTTSEEIERLNQQLMLANMRLSHIAKTDELTQLFNRREIERIFHELWENARNEKSELSIIMLDIDHFKRVNDNFGHAIGDKVLKEVAALIFSCLDLKRKESAGRWGGEEFLVVLPNRSLNEAIFTAEKIRMSVENHDFKVSDMGKQTVSLGVTALRNSEDENQIFIRADQALYRSKNSGRNKVTTT